MTDYYSILAEAMRAPEAQDAQWRRGIYDRARQMLLTRLKARRPPAPPAAIAAEQSALDAAIRRIEADMSSPDFADDGSGDIADATSLAAERRPPAGALPFRSGTLIVFAIVAAALCAGAFLWVQRTHQSSAVPSTKTAAPGNAARPAAATAAALKDGDLPPGVDGTADIEISYVFRRQPTFYRTLAPVGTVIVDKLQHFLYLIQPNNVALRYGIGLGGACTDLAGLRHVAGKAEWPPWDATPDMIAKKLAKPGTMAGGPANPLGARDLELDDHTSRINGTNAPKTIGTAVIFGCIRMVNEDIVDLYNRVPVGTPVVVN
jgi:lipoprotein-anchoring transpeptidase ErfK/SrfK